jgi:hypothetical protein
VVAAGRRTPGRRVAGGHGAPGGLGDDGLRVRFPEKVPADWTYGPDSYIRLYLADVADASPIQAANRQFLTPVEARAQPAVQDNHLFFEEALLVATGRS